MQGMLGYGRFGWMGCRKNRCIAFSVSLHMPTDTTLYACLLCTLHSPALTFTHSSIHPSTMTCHIRMMRSNHIQSLGSKGAFRAASSNTISWEEKSNRIYLLIRAYFTPISVQQLWSPRSSKKRGERKEGRTQV
jgi:hypothetical protein